MRFDALVLFSRVAQIRERPAKGERRYGCLKQ
jgi:hypothetical protein